MQRGPVLGPILAEGPPNLTTSMSQPSSSWSGYSKPDHHLQHPHQHQEQQLQLHQLHPLHQQQQQRRKPYHQEGSTSHHHMTDSSPKGQLFLHVCQQPERARLCSYKEENDTMDRRPVDPPPVIELKAGKGDMGDLLDSVSFFIRASLVQAEMQDHSYPAIKMPGGIEATAGEIIQTPEKLKHIDGTTAVLCIFAKLSVRLPGVFRLKFTLYEAAEQGVIEITHTFSEPFEVFSPKLFKGMHESTLLTRHLAAQGLKVKLRTDSTSGKQSRRRSQASISTTNTSKQTPSIHSRAPMTVSVPASTIPNHHEPPPPPPSLEPYRPATELHRPVQAPISAPIPSLVWRPQYNSTFNEHGETTDRRPLLPDDVDSGARKMRRLGRDDGFFPSLMDMSSRIDLPLPGVSSDLSAFALDHSRTSESSSRGVSHPLSSTKGKERSQSSYPPESTSSTSSALQSNKRYRDTSPIPTFHENKLGLGSGDDGIPKLPSLSSLALSVPPNGRALGQPMQPQTFVLPRLNNFITPSLDNSNDSSGLSTPSGRPFLPPINLPPRDVDSSRRSSLLPTKMERP